VVLSVSKINADDLKYQFASLSLINRLTQFVVFKGPISSIYFYVPYNYLMRQGGGRACRKLREMHVLEKAQLEIPRMSIFRKTILRADDLWRSEFALVMFVEVEWPTMHISRM